MFQIREHYGIQRVEVIFQTIDKINNDPHLLKNLKLGVEIRDTCWYAPIALQHTIDLIQESVTTPYGVKSAASLSHRQCSNATSTEAPLIAVAGPASSSIALQVQNLLQLFSIPQIGYSTTSKDLSDKVRFNTFMRVVPSDHYQAKAMLDIVKHNNWTYIHTVHTGNQKSLILFFDRSRNSIKFKRFYLMLPTQTKITVNLAFKHSASSPIRVESALHAKTR